MTVRFFTDAELYATGSLKWTGMPTSQGAPTLGAWVAEMDFGTAPEVERTITEAISKGFVGYPPRWLEGRLREATAAFQSARFGWQVAAGDVRGVPTVLSSLVAAIQHLTRPGSAVVVPTPAYMPFLTIPVALGRRVIEVPALRGAEAAGGWGLDLEAIESALEQGAGMVILCNPWNPTGRVLDEAELRALHAVVARHDAIVFSDEIHSPVVPAGTPFVSYARLGEEFAAHTVTATAATKGWNFAGLPNAQVILPDPDLRRKWDRIPHVVGAEAVPLGVLGTITAYEGAALAAEGIDLWQREVMEVITANIALVDAALAGTVVSFTRPQSTYLTWWGLEAFDFGGLEPAVHMREAARVGVNAGSTMGSGYETWIRGTSPVPLTPPAGSRRGSWQPCRPERRRPRPASARHGARHSGQGAGLARIASMPATMVSQARAAASTTAVGSVASVAKDKSETTLIPQTSTPRECKVIASITVDMPTQSAPVEASHQVSTRVWYSGPRRSA